MSFANKECGISEPGMASNVNFVGRYRKCRPSNSKSLLTVYEAVANAFDATEQLGKDGRIVVRIMKRVDGTIFDDGKSPPKYILTGYEIEDNGVGFNDDNLKFFVTVHPI